MGKSLISINVVFTIICLLELLIVDDVDPNLLKYEVLIVDVYVVFLGYYLIKNILHPYLVLCLMINLFLCSRIWLDIFFDGIPYYYTTFFSNYPFIDSVQRSICMMLILTFSGLNIGLVIFKGTTGLSYDKKMISIPESNKIKKYAKWCMIFCLVPSLYRTYDLYHFVSDYGYTALYIASQTGQRNDGGILGHVFVLFNVSFFCFLAANPKGREFIRYSVMFIVVSMLSLLAGGRGGFATLLGTFLTYISVFKKRISMRIIILMGIVLMLLFQITSIYRDNKADFNVDFSGEFARPFFQSQGVSITVLGYATQIESNGILDVIYPIVAYFDEKLNDEYSSDKATYNYPYRLSSSINQDMYVHGMGTGSSFVAELYSAGGMLAVFGGAIVLSFFINFSLPLFGKNFFGVLALLMFWQSVYFMPRGSLLGWLIPAIKWFIFLYVLKICGQKLVLYRRR